METKKLQKIDKILLISALFLIGFTIYQKYNQIITIKPYNPTVPNKSILKENIFYNEYNKAKELSLLYNQKLVLIFGAKWCPYCKDLKRDVARIQEFKEYIVCFIDIDDFKEMTQQYRISSLPTSLIIFNNIEINRKNGYKYKDYCEWLDHNSHGEKTWSELSL